MSTVHVADTPDYRCENACDHVKVTECTITLLSIQMTLSTSMEERRWRVSKSDTTSLVSLTLTLLENCLWKKTAGPPRRFSSILQQQVQPCGWLWLSMGLGRRYSDTIYNRCLHASVHGGVTRCTYTPQCPALVAIKSVSWWWWYLLSQV